MLIPRSIPILTHHLLNLHFFKKTHFPLPLIIHFFILSPPCTSTKPICLLPIHVRSDHCAWPPSFPYFSMPCDYTHHTRSPSLIYFHPPRSHSYPFLSLTRSPYPFPAHAYHHTYFSLTCTTHSIDPMPTPSYTVHIHFSSSSCKYHTYHPHHPSDSSSFHLYHFPRVRSLLTFIPITTVTILPISTFHSTIQNHFSQYPANPFPSPTFENSSSWFDESKKL